MARDKDKKLERLARVHLFRNCSENELKAIGAIADQVSLEPGYQLCRQGGPSYDCYVIIDGEADVFIDDGHVATVGPGQSVGEMGLIERRPRNATVVAKTPMEAYVIDGSRFAEMCAKAPNVMFAIMADLSSRLRKLESEIEAWN